MTSVEMIERVLRSDLLISELIVLPVGGATLAQIQAEQDAIGSKFSECFLRFLQRWNGINLDTLLLFGCDGGHPEIPRLRDRQGLVPKELALGVAIGSDPAGFVYVEVPDGRVVAVDTQGGGREAVGADFDDFICRYVFGEDSQLFGSEDWKQELREAGLLP